MFDKTKKLSLAVRSDVDKFILCDDERTIIQNIRMMSPTAQKMIFDLSGDLTRRLPRSRAVLRLAGTSE